MRKLGVDEGHGDSDDFEVKVGMHRGSIFSSLLFLIVMEPRGYIPRVYGCLAVEVAICG